MLRLHSASQNGALLSESYIEPNSEKFKTEVDGNSNEI